MSTGLENRYSKKWYPLKMRIRWIFKSLIPQSEYIYKLCKRYVDMYNGENNVNIETNGELLFLRKYLNGCKIVFDVGANVGDWTSWVLRIDPNLTVHCFEPSRATFEVLKRNNFSSNVIYNNFGFGSKSCERTLYIVEEGSGINSLYRREGLEYLGIQKAETEEIIRVDTIDNYCISNGMTSIDFLKIDVEGHELEVFQGMVEMLRQGRIGVIQFEYGGTFIDARIFLKDIWDFVIKVNSNYKFYKIHTTNILHVPKYSQTLENFQYQNWAIIRNEYP